MNSPCSVVSKSNYGMSFEYQYKQWVINLQGLHYSEASIQLDGMTSGCSIAKEYPNGL